MNLRERALAAIGGEEVWPVPHDLFCNCIYPKIFAGLCSHYGVAEGDAEGLFRAVGAHTRWGAPVYVGPAPEERFYDPGGGREPIRMWRNIWGTWDGLESYFDGIERPLQAVETVAEIDAYPWPSPDWHDYNQIAFGAVPPGADLSPAGWAERNRDYVRVACHVWNPVFSRVADMCGMETALINMAARPDLVEAIVAHIGDYSVEFFTRLAKSCEGHADFLRFSDDFASQRGMIMSPDQWRHYFLPLWKRLFPIAHKYGMKAMMHSCGAIRPVLGDLIDAGLDCFETVQVDSAGMDPAELKREFGDHLTFYGGVETQKVLTQGTAEDVRAEVRRLARTFGKGGRYILTSAHTMMDDIPTENAVAMFEEARTYVPD